MTDQIGGPAIASAVTDALLPLESSGYLPTPAGLVYALHDLGEADRLLAALLVDGDDTRSLQATRAYLERRAARRWLGAQ
jgi:hypothetical protein